MSTIFFTSCNALAAIISTFDSDLEGWRIKQYSGSSQDGEFNDDKISYHATGGNPDGYAQFEDFAGDYADFFCAPEKFLGNWKKMAVTAVSYDMKIIDFDNWGDEVHGNPYGIYIKGADGIAGWSMSAPENKTDWITIYAPLSEFTIFYGTATLDAIFSDVSGMVIKADMFSPTKDFVGLDNVKLNIAPVPVPSSILLFSFGLGSLIFLKMITLKKI